LDLCYNVQTSGRDVALESDVALCAEAGFSRVEISFAKARAFLKTHDLTDLTRLLDAHGVRCVTINAIFGLNFSDRKRWDEILRQFDFACLLGEATGAGAVVVLTNDRSSLPENAGEKEIYADTVRALDRLGEYGDARGMKIALEPVGTMAVGDTETARRIINDVNRRNVGLAVDAFNLYLWDLGADFDRISAVDPDKIFVAHINDAERVPFATLNQRRRCMPGDGRIDVAAYVSCLRASGYDGPVSVEVMNPAIWEKGPRIVIPEAYEKAKKFII
jgi:2-keto-myo-inositol isomerase